MYQELQIFCSSLNYIYVQEGRKAKIEDQKDISRDKQVMTFWTGGHNIPT